MPNTPQIDTIDHAHLALQTDFPLRTLNTLGIAATADAYLPVTSLADLLLVRRDPAWSALPRLILGGGSNVVLTQDFPGLVLHMRNRGIAIVGEDADAIYVRAAAGESWHALVEWTLSHGLSGLENLSLIPGSVGAAPIQNIGAYGIELQDRFHSLGALDFVSGELLTLNRADCAFGYRDSIFKNGLRDRAVIIDVTFCLPRRWQADLRYGDISVELAAQDIQAPCARDISNAVIAIRMRKLPDPAVIGNVGSFFKNPVVSAAQKDALLAHHPALISYPFADGYFKLAAGWLIDQCGWKGKTLGPVAMYQKQALVLVNLGGAAGSDVVRLAAAVQSDVVARFGVTLETEPVFV